MLTGGGYWWHLVQLEHQYIRLISCPPQPSSFSFSYVCACAYVSMKTRPSAHNVSGFPLFFNLWQSELNCYRPWSIYWLELQMLIFSHTDYSNLIYRLFNLAQVRGQRNGLITLPHTATITTVDWHPTLPIFLAGSADNSVRVTSIL